MDKNENSEKLSEGSELAEGARRSRRLIGRLVGALIVGATVFLSYWVYSDLVFHPRTDDAYVRANTVGIAPHVSGPIVSLPLVDNQPVEEGQVLFVIDPRPYEAALEEAQAEMVLTNLEIEGLSRGVLAAEAELEHRQAEAAYARQYLDRIRPLLADQFVTANQVFEAETDLAASQASVERARFELEQAKKDLGEYGGMNARRQAAEAKLYNAELNLAYCTVRSPFNGYVTNLNIAVGEYANQGQEVFALVDNRTWYVLANFREIFLDQIRPGMEAEVYLMTYPGRRFKGVVQGIGWALWQKNGSTVRGLPDVEPSLNWVRLAQRFPVRIILEPPDYNQPYRMGNTAVVTIKGSASSRPAGEAPL
ncbi:MAG: efflux RND transporter periplasmic adaptor subunit [Myxococcota bacterium]|nr:efflux RND transporter periplasmic adaptor subunit [Myxococcota bacterium]